MADVERGDLEDTTARYRAAAREVRDNNIDTANNSAFVEIGERRLRLFPDTRDFSDYTCIGIVQVREKLPIRRRCWMRSICHRVWIAARSAPQGLCDRSSVGSAAPAKLTRWPSGWLGQRRARCRSGYRPVSAAAKRCQPL